MESVKERMFSLVECGNYDAAYSLIAENLRGEIENLKSDAQYCVIAATAFKYKNDYKRAFSIMTIGLIADCHNYELYLMLGEYYTMTNLNQALLCFYQALFYCESEEDSQTIQEYIESVVSQGASIRQVSIVIVTRNQSEELKRCLNGIVDTVMPGLYEIVVIDNASEDGTFDWLSGIEGISCALMDENIGYTRACNQGIKLSNSFNDILLLDADAELLDNSLFYLMLGLYSQEHVGAIGGITNDFIITQKLHMETGDMKEVLNIAHQVNSPMEMPLERTSYLSDHALLINRDALDRVGILDESFSPDLYEDKDFCTRVNLAGFKVLLCFNSFVIKHMDRHSIYDADGSFAEANKITFENKWHCNIDYSNSVRLSLIDMIEADENAPLEVLELGCAMGATLSRINRMWPNSKVHGVEYVDSVVRIGREIADIIQGDVETMPIPYQYNQFDYIICADVLEHLRNPEDTLKRFLPYLKENGRFIISLPNIRHFAVLEMLGLHGRFDYADSGILDNTHLKFFTRDTAAEMIQNAGLKILKMERNYNGHPEDNQFIQKLTATFDVVDPEELKVFQYYFVAARK